MQITSNEDPDQHGAGSYGGFGMEVSKNSHGKERVRKDFSTGYRYSRGVGVDVSSVLNRIKEQDICLVFRLLQV
jgi:hypothetical protein